jgi:peptide/nickel transport system ATP-binding protein
MLLSVRDLRVSFRMEKGQRIEAVRGISFDVPENSTVALVANRARARASRPCRS